MLKAKGEYNQEQSFLGILIKASYFNVYSEHSIILMEYLNHGCLFCVCILHEIIQPFCFAYQKSINNISSQNSLNKYFLTKLFYKNKLFLKNKKEQIYMITNQTLDEKTKEIVISDFKNFYYNYLEKILKEIDVGDFSHISSFDESDDRIPDLYAMGIIELKHNGKFVEANREYIVLIKNFPQIDSSILYSWSKTLMAAGALEEGYAVLIFSVKILVALRYQMINNSPFQQTIQLFRLINIIGRENPQELLWYMNMLAGLHSYTDNSDNEIYKFQKNLIENLDFSLINWNKYLNVEKELGRCFLKEQEILMKSSGLNL